MTLVRVGVMLSSWHRWWSVVTSETLSRQSKITERRLKKRAKSF